MRRQKINFSRKTSVTQTLPIRPHHWESDFNMRFRRVKYSNRNRHQITHPGSLENTKQDKYQKKFTLQKLQLWKTKVKVLKEVTGKKQISTYRGSRIRIIMNFSSETMQTKESKLKYLVLKTENQRKF